MTKFEELTGILTDTGHDDFFQATPSEDQIPTSSELAEGLSLTFQPRAEFQPLCEKYEFRMSIAKA